MLGFPRKLWDPPNHSSPKFAENTTNSSEILRCSIKIPGIPRTTGDRPLSESMKFPQIPRKSGNSPKYAPNRVLSDVVWDQKRHWRPKYCVLWHFDASGTNIYERARLHIYIYICAVKLKTGPSFALLKVKNWSNLFCFFLFFVFENPVLPAERRGLFENKQATKNNKTKHSF